MAGGSSSNKKKRSRDWRTEKIIELGGKKLLDAILRGESDHPDFSIDPKDVVILPRASFVVATDTDTDTDIVFPPVHPERQLIRPVWRKEFYPRYRKDRALALAAEDQKKLFHLSRLNIQEESDNDKSDYDYPNIANFRQLSEMERFESKYYQRNLARYLRDEEISDGFDVGYYPYRDAAGICSSGFIFRHYKPPEVNLPRDEFNTLVLLSQLAMSVYNMYQLHPTHYDNVQVLKAMKFGPYATNFNITFQASFPTSPTTFQTRVINSAFSKYTEFEILLVRNCKTSHNNLPSKEETDYVGDQSIPGFPFDMDSLSDFNEQDPHLDNALPVPSKEKLPLYLCQFALHQYNIDLHLRDTWDGADHDGDDELYDNVKVLNILKTLKTLNDEDGTTYYIIFAASLLDDSGNPQIFETKIFMSPLVPTTKIKIKFVRIKGN